MYNTALTLHVKGTRTEDQADRMRLLEKAQTFSLRAWDILYASGVSVSSSTGHALLDILTMSILNCLALSSLQLYRFGDSPLYINRLIEFAVTVRSDYHQDQDDERTSATLQQHKVFFLFSHECSCLQPAFCRGCCLRAICSNTWSYVHSVNTVSFTHLTLPTSYSTLISSVLIHL